MTYGLSRRIFLPLALAGIVASAIPASAAESMDAAIAELQHEWAHVNYDLSEGQQEAAYPTLIAKANTVLAQFPDRAEPLGWSAIILSSYAKVQGGLGALDSAEKARDQLMAAMKIDDKALNGGLYTSLGALYYKVPGWPIGFGSDQKAKEYLERGLAMNPTGIDQNYFYGDFLLDQGEKAEAKTYLSKALSAPPRPGREDADAGRRREIQSALQVATK